MYSYSTFDLSFVFVTQFFENTFWYLLDLRSVDLRSVAVGSHCVTRDAVRLSMQTVRPLKGQPARPHSSATPTIAFVYNLVHPA